MTTTRSYLILCTLLIGSGPGRASDLTNKTDPLSVVMLQAVRRGMSTLSLRPAERTDQDLLWATWSDHGPFERDPDDARTASHLSLIRRVGSRASVIWSRTFPGAFEPTIQTLYGSTLPNDRKIVLLSYQLGGDEAVGTVFSLAADDAVAEIGSVAAQSVELRPEQDNLLWSQVSPADPPDCYRLDPTGRRLMRVACPEQGQPSPGLIPPPGTPAAAPPARTALPPG